MNKLTKIISTGVVASSLLFTGLQPTMAANYTVKSGDTLWEIANSNKTTVKGLMEVNDLNSTTIYPNQVLNVDPLTNINGETSYTVVQGDTLNKIAKVFRLSFEQIRDYNPQIQNINLIYPGQKISLVPGAKPASSTSVNVVQPAKVEETNKSRFSAGEIDLLSRLVTAEALGEPFEGKVAVAAVVLNRIESSQFPDSISGIVYQAGQFSPVSNGSINKPYSEESKRAVLEAINGRDPSQGALFFYNPRTSSSTWILSRPVVTVIANHNFAK